MKKTVLALAIVAVAAGHVVGSGFPGLRQIEGSRTSREAGWKPDGAAAYLDQRMDTWFARGDKLRTGQGQAICVSCHTVIPYALARPALRRTMHVSDPTPQETRLVDETIRRVETFGTHQLIFEDETNRLASRGTEAVLYSLLLANARATGGRKDLDEPIGKALAHLWETQRADGAWDWLDFSLEPFESADATYQGAAWAAMATGLSGRETDGKPGRRKLVTYLKSNYAAQNLYNRAWALVASVRIKELLTRADRDALVADISARQRADGGWSMDGIGPWRWSRTAGPFRSPGERDQSLSSQSDGLATGLIVYALRLAGVAADQRVALEGLRWLRENQQPLRADDRDAPPWRAHSMNYDREHGGARGEPWRRFFMSDAATAFSVLALTSSE